MNKASDLNNTGGGAVRFCLFSSRRGRRHLPLSYQESENHFVIHMIERKKTTALPCTTMGGATSEAEPLERSRSACTVCGCGCAVTLEARGDRVLRVCPAEH